jgi:sarcosine dehydrogenase
MAGVKIFEDTKVTRIDRGQRPHPGVETPFGTIACEKVVVCAGHVDAHPSAAAHGVNVPLVRSNTST